LGGVKSVLEVAQQRSVSGCGESAQPAHFGVEAKEQNGDRAESDGETDTHPHNHPDLQLQVGSLLYLF
jgi:hypothetical protein